MDKEQLNIAICGGTGRMGMAVSQMLENQYRHSIAGKISSNTTDYELGSIVASADIVIDFSLPAATNRILESAITNKTPLVICTTGLDAKQLEKMQRAGSDIPILYAPNTSVGANLITELSGKIAAILKDYDVEIIDTHHRHKKDSPSGTAIAIGKSVASSRGDNYNDVVNIGRSGRDMRKDREIGIASLRSGGIYGCHDVLFASENEVVTISHQALSRNVFAEGAIKAAIWLAAKPKGFYHMKDVI